MTLYLDHAATSPLRPEAREAYLRACDVGANPSSVHALGRKARVMVEEARSVILDRLGATGSGGLVFTSGGTEANALALRQSQAFDYIIISGGEHDSLFAAAQALGKPFVIAPLTRHGQVDISALSGLIKDNEGRPFACLMLANNETGVISDVAAAADIVHAAGGWVHVDAVQALGKIAVDFPSLGADSASFSAHKIGGPQGVGALAYDRSRVLQPLIIGGGQELGLRAGTENVAGIAGFAAALATCHSHDAGLMAAQTEVESLLKAQGVTILGEGAPRLPGVLYIAQPHWASNLQLIHLDMAGICVSSGSACSSGKVKSSRVVTAMGYPELADKVLRVSAGWTTRADDWHRFYDVWSTGYDAYLKRHTREKELS
ncbi:MAG: cysteine desulfurase family protein [Asticcacaulis sp.]